MVSYYFLGPVLRVLALLVELLELSVGMIEVENLLHAVLENELVDFQLHLLVVIFEDLIFFNQAFYC